MAKTKPIKVGDTLPNFQLLDQDGKTVSSSDLIGKGCLVLYFYPKDDTTGCTAQACAFRDSYEIFQQRGAEVVGISSDTATTHSQFRSKHNLPFKLLSDRNGEVRKLFGVPPSMGLLPGRVTYIMDRKGVVHHVFSSQLNIQKHIDESLRILDEIGCRSQ